MTTPPTTDSALDVVLREYQNIWTELFNRWDTQRHAFNYTVSIVSVALGLGFTENVSLPPELFFALPFVLAPFAFIFFDNELMIWAIVAYSLRDTSVRINELLPDHAPVMAFDSSRFKYLSPQAAFLHLTLSIGRWLIFVTPMAVSLAYAMAASTRVGRFPYTLIAAADFLLLGYFGWVMFVAVRERRRLWSATAAQSGSGS